MQVYMSYSRADEEFAGELASRLSESGINVFDPLRDVALGENWPSTIGEALQESDAMIVLLSPDSVKSEWVRREIDFALGSPRFAGRLIPVLVRPTEEIPWILRNLQPVTVGKDRAKVGHRILQQLQRARRVAESWQSKVGASPRKSSCLIRAETGALPANWQTWSAITASLFGTALPTLLGHSSGMTKSARRLRAAIGSSLSLHLIQSNQGG